MQAAVESGHRCYLCVAELGLHFPEAPQLVEKVNDKAAGQHFSVNRGVNGDTYFDNGALSSADEHEVLLYISAEAAHIRDQNPIAVSNGCVVYVFVSEMLVWSANLRVWNIN